MDSVKPAKLFSPSRRMLTPSNPDCGNQGGSEGPPSRQRSEPAAGPGVSKGVFPLNGKSTLSNLFYSCYGIAASL